MAFTIDKRTQQAMDAITMSEMQAAGQGWIEGKAANPNGSVMSNGNGGLALDMPPIVTDGEQGELEEQDEGPIPRFQRWIIFSCKLHKTAIVRAILFCLFCAYWIYFGFAVAYDLELAVSLIVMTGIVIFCVVYVYIRNHFGEKIYNSCCLPIGVVWDRTWPTTKWFILPGLLILLVLYLAFFVILEFRQLRSLVGMIVFFCYTYLISKHPGKVVWRPIIWGFALQFLFAILVLRWTFGYEVIKFISVQVTTFVEYAYDGAATVFGNPTLMFHPFSMMGMSLLIWIGSVMAVLYYVGFTQILAEKMAWLMLVTMKTTAIETLSVAANIFLNGMDVMIMLRPYLHRLTKSEFHCLLVGGHATVAGFAFAIFVMFGAPPEHLLTAAVMSAPATIAIAKLSWPETEGHLSVTKSMEDVKLTRGDDTNVFEASANGAAVAGKTATAVLLNYISFIAFLYWVNATLDWIGDHVGFDGLSFEEICSYVMWPVVVIMGVDLADARESAMLVGLKVFASEILAFQRLGVSVRNGRLSPRSQAITTYALSGFSSVSTLAIAVGVWRAICPQKVPEMASQMFRGLSDANISCFFTACIAGLMYDPSLEVATTATPAQQLAAAFMNWVPTYDVLMRLLPSL